NHYDVFVCDEVHRDVVVAGVADLLELKEGRSGHEAVVADRGQQRPAPFEGGEAHCGGGGGERGWGGGPRAGVAAGSGCDHRDAAGAQHGVCAAQDGGEPGQQLCDVAVGEVGGVVAVAVVGLVHTGAGGGPDLSVHGRPVRR